MQEAVDLFVGQSLAVDLGFGEPTGQIVARVLSAIGENWHEVLAEFLGRLRGALRVDTEGQLRYRPSLKLRIIFFGQPQQSGDDLGRVGKRELVAQICAAVAGEVID